MASADDYKRRYHGLLSDDDLTIHGGIETFTASSHVVWYGNSRYLRGSPIIMALSYTELRQQDPIGGMYRHAEASEAEEIIKTANRCFIVYQPASLVVHIPIRKDGDVDEVRYSSENIHGTSLALFRHAFGALTRQYAAQPKILLHIPDEVMERCALSLVASLDQIVEAKRSLLTA